jgi:hypothetical protein
MHDPWDISNISVLLNHWKNCDIHNVSAIPMYEITHVNILLEIVY